jgi:hypothetical protein
MRSLCIAIMLMASACVSTSAHNKAAPAGLLTEMKAACGGSAWDRAQAWHERSTAEIPGMPLFENEVWHDLHSLKSAMVSKAGGRVMRATGYNGTVAWLRGPDGQVRTSDDPARLRQQRRDAYLSSFGWFFPDRFPAAFKLMGEADYEGAKYLVLNIAPNDADAFDLWIDPQSRLVRRIVAGEESADLADYRSFHGVCTATTGRQRGAAGAPEMVLRVLDVTTDEPAPSSVFDPPR